MRPSHQRVLDHLRANPTHTIGQAAAALNLTKIGHPTDLPADCAFFLEVLDVFLSGHCLTPTTEEAAREAASAEEEDWTCTHGPGDDCAKCAFNLGTAFNTK